jgi:hypothetical protein
MKPITKMKDHNIRVQKTRVRGWKARDGKLNRALRMRITP